MALTADEVARLAGLARLRLTPEECAALAPELDVILRSVHSISQVVTPDVPLMTHPLPLTNVMRDDEVTPSLPVEQVLTGAPDADEGRFRVPHILGEE